MLTEVRLQKRVLYRKEHVQLWKYLSEFSLEWKSFQTKFAEKKQNTHLFLIFFFSEKNAVYQKSGKMWQM